MNTGEPGWTSSHSRLNSSSEYTKSMRSANVIGFTGAEVSTCSLALMTVSTLDNARATTSGRDNISARIRSSK